MKKLLALLLGSVMAATMVAGLAACNKDKPGPDKPGPDKPGPGPTVDDEKAPRRADTREAAYEAYDYNNELVGSYKTIADAINATVEADLDFMEDEEIADGSKGGYVIKKGGTKHLFDNKKGYAEGNSDIYWYYVNGSELAGFNCWDNTGTDADSMGMITNSKVITHQTTNMGLSSVQSWNGYGVLDEHGKELDTVVQSWELGNAMDASVLTFPVRKQGVAGLKYEIDLSEIQITPPYAGYEYPVYAFIGFYAWQDYYVVANGIACDTETGVWYEYIGTSRDDSFSDVEYNLGDPIMKSTWTDLDNDGYWTPDAETLTLEIKTVKQYDELDDENYFEDQYKITIDGEVKFETLIDAEKVNSVATATYSQDNGYVFTAGLDIKNDIETGVRVQNADYFNGAKFLNLVVSSAQVYFPTLEELNDTEAKVTIDPLLRGNWYDMLLANDTESEGTYDYTILQTYACTTYEAKDSVDYYSFRYDGTPVSANELGGLLKTYQDKINGLANMTAANIDEYLDDYTEVTKWYGLNANHDQSSGMPQQYLNLLDFSVYEASVSVYEESLNLSDEAKAFIEAFKTLSPCTATTYPYAGWTRPEGSEEPVAGYFWDEAQYFAELYEDFNALEEDEQNKVLTRISEDNFNDWELAYTSVKAYLENEEYMAKSYKLGAMNMDGSFVTYTGEEALQKIVAILYRVRTNFFKSSGAAGDYVLDSDSQTGFMYEFHMLFLMKMMEKEQVELPAFVDAMMDLVTSTARAQGFVNDFDTYLYPVLTLAGEIYARQQKGEYVWLDEHIAEVVNKYMIGRTSLEETGFNWNWGNGKHYGIRDRLTNYEYYFGLPNGEKSDDDDMEPALQLIFDVVLACDPNAKVQDSKFGFEEKVTPLTEDPTKTGSEAAIAVVNEIKALTDLASYSYLGWTAPEEAESNVGYLFTELGAFRTLAAKREALTVIEKAYVNANTVDYKANYEAWTTLSNEIAALEETKENFWTKTFEVLEPGCNKTANKTLTGEQVLAEIYNATYLVKSGKVLSGMAHYDEKDGAKSMTQQSAFFTSMWITKLVLLAEDEGVTLPATVKANLDAIDYNAFYTNLYYPVMTTLAIAERIYKEEIKTMEDFTDDELAFLNEVWTAGYEQKGQLATHWNGDGNKFSGWWGDRSPKFVQDLGGTMTSGATKDLVKDYVAVLSKFLSDNFYTIKDNGWGTTADEILAVTLTEDSLKVFDEFGKIGNLDTYVALGWKAPAETPIKGYLYSEAEYYTNTIKPLIKALSPEDLVTVTTLVGAQNMADWESLAAEVLAFDAEQAELIIHAAESDKQDSKQKDYTVGESLGVLLDAIARAKAAGEKLGFDNGIDKGVSFRPYFFYFELEGMGVEIPTVIKTRMEAVKMEETAAEKFETDIKYIIAIMKLAKAIDADAEHVLTEEEIKLVNDNLVGKTKFVDGGFSWAFTSDSNFKGDVVSYHGNSKGYKSYFGLTKTFDVYQALVINYLVENYGATALKYDHASAPDDCFMGIEAPITAKAE